LARALVDRGHLVGAAWDCESASQEAERMRPQAAVLDLRLPTCSGIDLLRQLRAGHPQIRVLMLTGYGSIANAMEAVRLGAWDYLTKPADAEQILAALATAPSERGAIEHDFTPPSLDRIEWEHIQRVMADHGGNISHAADALGIHRRTLQRKLQKYPSAT
jgi:two-component system response regulator RegA